mmetsp:Transcript_47008/g.69640  ORF Transcript_47008/g.69640 Transcript_47008/m.69640 type:complete len:202 (-) Transcript_47008:328-933(-)
MRVLFVAVRKVRKSDILRFGLLYYLHLFLGQITLLWSSCVDVLCCSRRSNHVFLVVGGMSNLVSFLSVFLCFVLVFHLDEYVIMNMFGIPCKWPAFLLQILGERWSPARLQGHSIVFAYRFGVSVGGTGVKYRSLVVLIHPSSSDSCRVNVRHFCLGVGEGWIDFNPGGSDHIDAISTQPKVQTHLQIARHIAPQRLIPRR